MYLSIVNKIWTKIYSNIQIPYNGYIGNFIPLDITELKDSGQNEVYRYTCLYIYIYK